MAQRWNVGGNIKAKFGNVVVKYSYVMTYHPEKCSLTIRPKIQLTFPSTFTKAKKDGLIKAWNKAIAAAFNGKWKVVPVDPNRCEQCKNGIAIRVRVKFVTSWTWTDDFEVTVHDDNVRSDVNNWHVKDKDFSATGTGGGVVHELCHMLGLEDEYVDESTYPGKKESDLPKGAKDGIMNNTSKPILDRHMEIILFNRAKLNEKLPCPTYKLAKQ
ncbi:MAG: hypothetical protein K0U54_03270 [Bacteroidetes bacterium]|nr:hypothetical protein [Bacteroidota bacterium]